MKQFSRVLAGVGGLAALGLMLSAASGADEKLTIKQIMKKAHQGKPALCGKIVKGKATKEEKQEALDLYVALGKLKPPKGDEASWKEKTDALVKAVKECLADEKDGPADFGKAVKCGACHDVHKPAKKKK